MGEKSLFPLLGSSLGLQRPLRTEVPAVVVVVAVVLYALQLEERLLAVSTVDVAREVAVVEIEVVDPLVVPCASIMESHGAPVVYHLPVEVLCVALVAHVVYLPALAVARSRFSQEVTILDENREKEVYFNERNEWMGTSWDVQVANLPEAVKKSVMEKYSDYVIDDADYVVTPDNEWYILDLENKQIDKELKVKIDKDGVWL